MGIQQNTGAEHKSPRITIFGRVLIWILALVCIVFLNSASHSVLVKANCAARSVGVFENVVIGNLAGDAQVGNLEMYLAGSILPRLDFSNSDSLLASGSNYNGAKRWHGLKTGITASDVDVNQNIHGLSVPTVDERKNDNARWFDSSRMNADKGALGEPKRFFCCIRTLGSSIRSNSGGSDRLAQQPYLKKANDNKQPAESDVNPVAPVPCYRHGGKFGDRYGLACIFAAWGTAIALGFPAAIYFERVWCWRSASIIAVAIALDGMACASGIIGCLPWDWGRCLHDGQQHSYYQEFHVEILN
jgi:hypothetical protein